MTEFAGIWRKMPKIVYSRTLKHADWNSVIVKDVVPVEILERKAQTGGDLVLSGADIAAEFLRHDLIDEFALFVHPIVIGKGKPLFNQTVRTKLGLAGTREFGNGVVMLSYRRPEEDG